LEKSTPQNKTEKIILEQKRKENTHTHTIWIFEENFPKGLGQFYLRIFANYF
jgi:hypothetical protein